MARRTTLARCLRRGSADRGDARRGAARAGEGLGVRDGTEGSKGASEPNSMTHIIHRA